MLNETNCDLKRGADVLLNIDSVLNCGLGSW